ncbi:hypothetical protein [Streptomyces orinoci]|uniref:Secreted protein n=1 Tax=Streptomyces orinoci TaxID=67339 RepID=A0ABV3JU61_STRON|nr:hypothetical protein [Streptomyces orinoci]
MTPARRFLTTAAATLLLCLGSAALAAPAEADIDTSLLGGAVTVLSDGVVSTTLNGAPLLTIPNPAEGIV